jgi:hypothetical protein
VTTDSNHNLPELVRLVRAEFLEMPGLRVTARQARRLWRIDERSCAAVMSALVDARFLAVTRDGSFIRCGASMR